MFPTTSKLCKACGQVKDLSEFHERSSPSKKGVTLYQARCQPCLRQKMAENSMLSRFGITMDEFWERSEFQDHKCSICDKECTRDRLSVDHNHSCCPGKITCGQCVRGLICDRCNTGMGRFNDSAELLEKAALYLRTHSSLERTSSCTLEA